MNARLALLRLLLGVLAGRRLGKEDFEEVFLSSAWLKDQWRKS